MFTNNKINTNENQWIKALSLPLPLLSKFLFYIYFCFISLVQHIYELSYYLFTIITDFCFAKKGAFLGLQHNLA